MVRPHKIIFTWLIIAGIAISLLACGGGGGGTAQDTDTTENCTDQTASPCIDDLSDWKVRYQPHNGDCMECHTTCTPSHNPEFCLDCHEPHKKKSLNCTECHKIHDGLCLEGADWEQTEKRCYKCHKKAHL